MTTRSMTVFVIVFSVTYAIAYVLAVEKNYALFTYHPALEAFGFGAERPREGVAMYWYGWLAMAAAAGLVAGGIASVVPERLAKRLWSGWAWSVPLAAMFVFVYLLRGYFTR